MKVFLDTNVVVYANDARDARKHRIARKLVTERIAAQSGVISTQVLAEYASVAVGKLKQNPGTVRNQISAFEVLEIVQVTPGLLRRALEIHQVYGISVWDGGILAAAEQARCGVILSEDLNAGQSYAGVRVENPFA